ncbi:MAG: diaminopimelate epimerase [Bacteroidales bacterium]|nr:diaminopimelate epimerase [Bacteroidales bacterium]
MNRLHFYKYDGAGNDFVVIDARQGDPELTKSQVAHLCHRRFGIGADGLMTLGRGGTDFDFEMKYYNSDGLLGTMCGNGGRCIAALAHRLGLGHDGRLHFAACDGPHDAQIVVWHEESGVGIVQLSMHDVATNAIRRCLDGWWLDTGSPHYVQRVVGLEHFDVLGEGRRLRHHPAFEGGTNVDFIEDRPDGTLFVRTFERGVEDETMACGTGVTACALVTGNGSIATRGGDFRVRFDPTGTAFTNITLTGPVALNFEGDVTI